MEKKAPNPKADDAWFEVTLTGVRILVVEDDADTRNLIDVVLKACGADVVSVDAGTAGLARLEEKAFDLIVSDIGMPEMNGFEFMKKVRAAGVGTPSIALTAYTSEEDKNAAQEAGFDRFVRKPLEPSKLVRMIEECRYGRR